MLTAIADVLAPAEVAQARAALARAAWVDGRVTAGAQSAGVKRGSRWSSFFWAQSMVADDGARTLLHGLDRSVIEARAKLGDKDPTVLRLTATYHNLLRRWAQG